MFLHDKEVLELQELDAFIQALQDRFEDPTVARHAEIHICFLWQGKQPVTEYIQDFRSLAAHLKD